MILSVVMDGHHQSIRTNCFAEYWCEQGTLDSAVLLVYCTNGRECHNNPVGRGVVLSVSLLDLLDLLCCVLCGDERMATVQICH
mmetsp:Transcript_19960/g.22088  ORF Transcript_19960/g.22088 Transcript_19960/m.22088 type:complete len:84 (-) Transcript_19960:92-343(-)